MEQIKEEINRANPAIKESSLITYARILNIIYNRTNEHGEPADYKYFEDNKQKIYKYLEGVKSLKYRKTMLAALINIVRDPDIRAEYKTTMLDQWREANEEDSKQTKSDKQSENWISMEEVKNIYTNLKIDAAPLFKRKSLTRQEHNRLISFIILSLYVLLPPRRSTDYTEMLMLGEKPTSEKEQVNYIDGRDMVFNVYKTAKHYGVQKVRMPNTLIQILKQWQKMFPHNRYLLFDFCGKKLSNVYITHYLNKIFGKKISVNMLRHIYISEKVLAGVPKLTELQKEAHDMGHSVAQQTLYKKFDP